MPITIMQQPSVNDGEEGANRPKYLILHCIGYDSQKALNILTKTVEQGGGGVSAHYFIPELELGFLEEKASYPVYQLVPENKKAKHAGLSAWQQDVNLNSCSIGIEFSSPNYANAQKKAENEALNWFHFEEFGGQQIVAGIELIKALIQRHQFEPTAILAHSDIAPFRLSPEHAVILGKTDPGPTFPWEKLARAGIGVWPKSERMRAGLLDLSISHVQQLLLDYGYQLDLSGEMDEKTKYVLRAFQWHFMPESELDGVISDQLVVRLENLIDKHYAYEPLCHQQPAKEMPLSFTRMQSPG